MQSKGQANKQHYFSSIVPFDYKINKPEQFLKNKEFYKPEEFIWNNPHRTSNKIYPYYHRANQQYKQKVKPLIQRLEEEDRKGAETERIQRLTRIREQTRSKFFNRVKQREWLEDKAHENGRNKDYVVLQRLRRNSEKNFASFKQPSQMPNYSKYTNMNSITPKSRVITNIQNGQQSSYNKGLQSYDKNLQDIKQLIQHELDAKRDKIRQVFNSRKTKNRELKITKRLPSGINKY